jgi:hypothetical protein
MRIVYPGAHQWCCLFEREGVRELHSSRWIRDHVLGQRTVVFETRHLPLIAESRIVRIMLAL